MRNGGALRCCVALVQIFWLWCANAVFHSVLLFWMGVMALVQDTAFEDGKVGDYLFLGNMVYTVSWRRTGAHFFTASNIFLFVD